MTQQEFDNAMKSRVKIILAVGIIISVIGFILSLGFDENRIAMILFALSALAFGTALGLCTTMLSYYNYRGYET